MTSTVKLLQKGGISYGNEYCWMLLKVVQCQLIRCVSYVLSYVYFDVKSVVHWSTNAKTASLNNKREKISSTLLKSGM